MRKSYGNPLGKLTAWMDRTSFIAHFISLSIVASSFNRHLQQQINTHYWNLPWAYWKYAPKRANHFSQQTWNVFVVLGSLGSKLHRANVASNSSHDNVFESLESIPTSDHPFPRQARQFFIILEHQNTLVGQWMRRPVRMRLPIDPSSFIDSFQSCVAFLPSGFSNPFCFQWRDRSFFQAYPQYSGYSGSVWDLVSV